jgi:diguanylate cyclase (GGDEF)-like protein
MARVGGDEFAGICGKIEAPDALVVARKINDALSRPFLLRDHECSIGVSIGISLYPEDGTDPETLVKKADGAMYRVKEGGKGGLFEWTRERLDSAPGKKRNTRIRIIRKPAISFAGFYL